VFPVRGEGAGRMGAGATGEVEAGATGRGPPVGDWAGPVLVRGRGRVGSRAVAGVGASERSGFSPVVRGAVGAAVVAARWGAGAGRGAREESPAVRARAARPPTGAAKRWARGSA